jgi:hypothetical protein
MAPSRTRGTGDDGQPSVGALSWLTVGAVGLAPPGLLGGQDDRASFPAQTRGSTKGSRPGPYRGDGAVRPERCSSTGLILTQWSDFDPGPAEIRSGIRSFTRQLRRCLLSCAGIAPTPQISEPILIKCVPGLREGLGQRAAHQWSGGGAGTGALRLCRVTLGPNADRLPG